MRASEPSSQKFAVPVFELLRFFLKSMVWLFRAYSVPSGREAPLKSRFLLKMELFFFVSDFYADRSLLEACSLESFLSTKEVGFRSVEELRSACFECGVMYCSSLRLLSCKTPPRGVRLSSTSICIFPVFTFTPLVSIIVISFFAPNDCILSVYRAYLRYYLSLSFSSFTNYLRAMIRLRYSARIKSNMLSLSRLP